MVLGLFWANLVLRIMYIMLNSVFGRSTAVIKFTSHPTCYLDTLPGSPSYTIKVRQFVAFLTQYILHKIAPTKMTTQKDLF